MNISYILYSYLSHSIHNMMVLYIFNHIDLLLLLFMMSSINYYLMIIV